MLDQAPQGSLPAAAWQGGILVLAGAAAFGALMALLPMPARPSSR